LVTATGLLPVDIAGSTVVSITHEFTSLSAAVVGATNASHINNTNLVTANVVLNIPCYYDSGADTAVVAISGYTTNAMNYIKIYTPSNIATESNNRQRHLGKQTTMGTFQIKPSSAADVITISTPYTVIDGLEILNYGGSGWGNNALKFNATASYSTVSNNIIRDEVANNNGSAILFFGNSTGFYIYNNIVSNAYNGIIDLRGWANPMYVYNNTVNGCKYGYVWGNTISVVLKNNIAQNCTAGYVGRFAASSDYNISDKPADAPGIHSKNSTTVKFADKNNADFHLDPFDTAAKNAGTDLSSVFATDIDGQARSGTWDIGAYETATNVFYSVGQNTTDHKTGTPTVDIASGIATFSTAQTATNMGVGDKITYNTSSVAYISAKISTTQWNVITVTGAAPANVTGQTVNSIAHVFTSLNAAISGASGANYLNTNNLTIGNYQLNFPCYYDTGADTTTVGVSDSYYVTSANNFVKIYTPNNILTEANASQRHNGKWKNDAYTLANNNATGINISISRASVAIDGLQITTRASSGGSYGISFSPNGLSSEYGNISNNIIRSENSAGSFARFAGISLASLGGSLGNFIIQNNIIYDFKTTNDSGLAIFTQNLITKIYNNTLVNNDRGVYAGNSTWYFFRNNIASGNTLDYSAVSTNAAHLNNISSDATSPNSGGTDCGGHSCRNQTVSFVDGANKDFHLANFDIAARDSGVDLSADPYFPFAIDIDGQLRPQGGIWDIGADEAATSTRINGGVRIDGGVKVKKN
jgi:hypothetical protein